MVYWLSVVRDADLAAPDRFVTVPFTLCALAFFGRYAFFCMVVRML